LCNDGRTLNGDVITTTSFEAMAIGDFTSACCAVGTSSPHPGNVTVEEFSVVASAIDEVHATVGSPYSHGESSITRKL
jgi:hypothetical protein